MTIQMELDVEQPSATEEMLDQSHGKNQEIDEARREEALRKVSLGVQDRLNTPEVSDEIAHVLNQLRQLVSDIGLTGRLPNGDIIIKKAKPKVSINTRIDEETLRILRIEAGAQGVGYQTLINRILRDFAEAHKERLIIQGPVARPVTKKA